MTLLDIMDPLNLLVCIGTENLLAIAWFCARRLAGRVGGSVGKQRGITATAPSVEVILSDGD